MPTKRDISIVGKLDLPPEIAKVIFAAMEKVDVSAEERCSNPECDVRINRSAQDVALGIAVGELRDALNPPEQPKRRTSRPPSRKVFDSEAPTRKMKPK